MAKTKSRCLGAAGAAFLAFAVGFTSSWGDRRYIAYRDVAVCERSAMGIKGIRKGDRGPDA
ncbi:hypothetical protein N8E89_24080 (plasmid) [Phyllobacterium sp. A18/5-2]|uniref:hypothetical protein n=1 Tax=Phyllobacterium sp. A18/5-2 TaxID=2978392 RepID=UPI0021C68461|nr:hypothetical protein [Phyllobacterium sp. A18/5-2]UXN66259.1 hypothetical protein N8E89_24080 [Phyllobacterium sp. A18/5-2]